MNFLQYCIGMLGLGTKISFSQGRKSMMVSLFRKIYLFAVNNIGSCQNKRSQNK